MVRLEGTALHAGGPVTVALRARPGPLRLVQRGRTAALSELTVARADRGVTLVGPGGAPQLDLCEHLMAAFAGLGIVDGVAIETDDPELPLLDGGAAEYARALLALGARGGGLCRLEVSRAATIRQGASVYRVSPWSGVHLEVEVDFPAPVGRERARWDGDPADFVERIAGARTFGWRREHEQLVASGRARGVPQPGLLVFDEGGAVAGCRPAEPGECARHKLLDLLGDLMVHGGWGRGALEVERPGHGATHGFLAKALAEGILVASPASRVPTIASAAARK